MTLDEQIAEFNKISPTPVKKWYGMWPYTSTRINMIRYEIRIIKKILKQPDMSKITVRSLNMLKKSLQHYASLPEVVAFLKKYPPRDYEEEVKSFCQRYKENA